MNSKESPEIIFAAIRRLHPSARTRWNTWFWRRNCNDVSYCISTCWRAVMTEYEQDDAEILFRILASQEISSSLLLIIQTVGGTHPASYLVVTGDSLPRSETSPVVKLIIHLHLVPSVLMTGARPLPPHIPSCCVQRHIYFTSCLLKNLRRRAVVKSNNTYLILQRNSDIWSQSN